jgi:hypothetical protein
MAASICAGSPSNGEVSQTTSGDPTETIRADSAALIDRLLAEAEFLLGLGLDILPANNKKPCNAAGHGAKAWQKVRCDLARVERGLIGASNPKRFYCSQQRPESNPGLSLRMGPGSVIDIEADDEAEARAVEYLFRGVAMPETVSFYSRRGRHDIYLFNTRLLVLESLTGSHGNYKFTTPDGDSVTIRLGIGGKASQSIIPPTPGRLWLPGRSFHDRPPAELPDEVAERIIEHARNRHTAARPRRQKSAAVVPRSKHHDPAPAATDHPPRFSDTDLCTSSYTGVHGWQIGNPIVESAVIEAVSATVAHSHGSRRTWLKRLARRLAAIPAVWEAICAGWLETSPGQAWVAGVAEQWHVRSLLNIRGGPQECVDDLTFSRRTVRVPMGETLDELYRQSCNESLPSGVADRIVGRRNAVLMPLARLCCVLQRRSGSTRFPLVGREAARVMGLNDHKQAARALQDLAELGIIKRMVKGRPGKWSEYLYLPLVAKNWPVAEVRRAA